MPTCGRVNVIKLKEHRPGSHTIFEKTDGNGNWIILVIDDHWFWASKYFERYKDKDPFSIENRKEWSDKYLNNDESREAISFLPIYCNNLSGFGQLILSDFPASKEAISYLKTFLQKNDLMHVAFIIDLGKAISNKRSDYKDFGELVVIPMLKKHNIPNYRIAYLTKGYKSIHKFHKIFKAELVDGKGRKLLDWWKILRDNIDHLYEIFNNKTKDSEYPHHPSEITLNLLKRPDFYVSFIDELSYTDAYGVWKWIANSLKSDDTLELKQYNYLCGKAFIKCGWSKRDLPFTAIRGLIYGIAKGMKDKNQPLVVESPGKIPPNEFLESNKNTIGCLSRCDLGETTFQDFSLNLREWLFCLELEKEQSKTRELACVASYSLSRDDKSFKLKICFTKPLDSKIFSDDYKGRVSDCWKRLKELFNNDNYIISFDYTCVSFIFPKVIKKKEVVSWE
jgi:hypothetical protein